MPKIIAIDFDGCLVDNAWPNIGAPHLHVFEAAKQEKARGAKLILWTCRVGDRLHEAVEFCRNFGLTFDAVNANLPEVVASFGCDCRKVCATEYWDDRAVLVRF